MFWSPYQFKTILWRNYLHKITSMQIFFYSRLHRNTIVTLRVRFTHTQAVRNNRTVDEFSETKPREDGDVQEERKKSKLLSP